MIEFLVLAAMTGQVGAVRSPHGEQIDFGTGATCMLSLPPGLYVNAQMSDTFEIFFDNRQDEQEKRVSGSARILEEVELQDRTRRKGVSERAYGKAMIQEAGYVGQNFSWYGYDILIGRQFIRFRGPSREMLPTPEAIVDACGSAK